MTCCSSSAARWPGGPWLIGVTRRNEASGFAAPAGEATVSLHLDTLAEEKVVELLIAATEDSPLRPHEMSILARRSGGNPLFLQELLSATRVAGTTEGLPDTVEAMVTAQIDQLASPDRRLLRVASVLGLRFRSALAEQLLDEPATAGAAAWRRLGDFVAQDGAGFYRFRHALMRDAAYEGLAYRRRRDLHLRAGETIERRARDRRRRPRPAGAALLPRPRPRQGLALLAAGRSTAAEPKFAIVGRRRAPRAGAAERTRHATAGRRGGGRGAGDAGRPARADGAVPRGAQRLRARPPAARRRRRRACQALHQAGHRRRRAAGATRRRWAGCGAASTLVSGNDDARRGQAARTADRRVRQCPPGAGTTAGRRALAERRRSRPPSGRTSGRRLRRHYFVLDWALVDLGRSDEAVHSQRALELYDELGKLGPQATIYNNLGTFAYYEARWDDAVELFEKARQLRLRLGRRGRRRDWARSTSPRC